MATVKDVEGKLNTHEAVCSERWKETIERIKRLELIMISSAGAVILMMAGMLSGGTTVRDLNCERIKLARSVFGMGLKVAGISILCQEVRVFNGLWMAGSPCPFMGKIGDAARDEWLQSPEKSPAGSIIRVEAKKIKEAASVTDPSSQREFNNDWPN